MGGYRWWIGEGTYLPNFPQHIRHITQHPQSSCQDSNQSSYSSTHPPTYLPNFSQNIRHIAKHPQSSCQDSNQSSEQTIDHRPVEEQGGNAAGGKGVAEPLGYRGGWVGGWVVCMRYPIDRYLSVLRRRNGWGVGGWGAGLPTLPGVKGLFVDDGVELDDSLGKGGDLAFEKLVDWEGVGGWVGGWVGGLEEEGEKEEDFFYQDG